MAPGVKHETEDLIDLKVVFQQGGCTFHFKIQKTATFQQLMQAVCERQGVDRRHVRFHTTEGRRIGENDTPVKLEMDEYVIEAFQFQIGG